jgi:hypothetical protein
LFHPAAATMMNKKQIQLKKKEKERKATEGKATKMTPEQKKKSEADRNAYVCAVCKQSFMVNAKVSQLQQHVDAKHAKQAGGLLHCFPAAAELQKAEAAALAKAEREQAGKAAATTGGGAAAAPAKKKEEDPLAHLTAALGSSKKK